MLSLSKVKNGKIIPRSYPSIGHMYGSKMISTERRHKQFERMK